MKEKESANSIFEFLTRKNPKVEYPAPNSKTLTSQRYYLCPKELRVWEDFSFSTLETIYGGKLIEAARRKGRSSLCYPRVSAIDCVVDDEPTTTCLLTTWNRSIVNAALEEDSVLSLFHPCIWRAKTGQNNPTESSAKKDTDRLKPDGGAVSSCATCRGPRNPSLVPERFPKDYKTASKWKSSPFLGEALIDGKWKIGEIQKPEAMPIRQVYTYCVKRGCRYGCILTTAEAFIFRIKPQTRTQGGVPPLLA